MLLHEVPHHIGDVGVLIYSGLVPRRAVLLNLAVSGSVLLGALCVLLVGARFAGLTAALLPITAANFIYIVTANLMPELQHERKLGKSSGQAASLAAGAAGLWFLSSALHD